jgi:hypothetical protein
LLDRPPPLCECGKVGATLAVHGPHTAAAILEDYFVVFLIVAIEPLDQIDGYAIAVPEF